MKLMAEQWICPGIPVSTQKGKNMKQPDRHIYHLQLKKPRPWKYPILSVKSNLLTTYNHGVYVSWGTWISRRPVRWRTPTGDPPWMFLETSWWIFQQAMFDYRRGNGESTFYRWFSCIFPLKVIKHIWKPPFIGDFPSIHREIPISPKQPRARLRFATSSPATWPPAWRARRPRPGNFRPLEDQSWVLSGND